MKEKEKKISTELSKKTRDLLNKHRITNLESYDRIIFRVVTKYDKGLENWIDKNRDAAEKSFIHPHYIK